MLVQQRTIKKAVVMSGVGLHTGTECTMTFKPAPENFGIRFRRVDLGGKPEIPADVDHVIDVSRGTTIGIGEAKVHTVEHVLAAIAGLQIDNIVIDLEGIEPPIGDGSAKPYVDALLDAGFEAQEAPKDYLVIDQTISYKNEEKGVEIVALPTDDFRVTVLVDYNNPALGSQHTGLFDLEKEFIPEFSMCRTFCFLHEVEQLRDAGLIKGGNLDNAIVIVDRELSGIELKELAVKLGVKDSVILGSTGAVNNKALHFKNEPARHKLLDLIGDLALIGAPLKAQILAARPGVPGKVGRAFQFDGQDSQIDFGPGPGNFGADNFTIEFWMKGPGNPNDGGEDFLSKRAVCGYCSQMNIQIVRGPRGEPGQLLCGLLDDRMPLGTGLTQVQSTMRVSDGQWHYVTWERRVDPGGATCSLLLYVDGQLNATANNKYISNITTTAHLVLAQNVCLGADPTSAYSGAVDGLAIWNRALSAEEMTENFQASVAGKHPAGKGLLHFWSAEKSAMAPSLLRSHVPKSAHPARSRRSREFCLI